MKKNRILLALPVLLLLLCSSHFSTPTQSQTKPQPAAASNAAARAGSFDVMKFGAKGNGQALDSPAINRAIEAAAAAGGGTVYFPAGKFLSVSIHLKSNVGLYLDHGAVIVAATPAEGLRYDPPEPNPWDKYQDFGHSHWHNSLIWGENLENISITGQGLIWGKGLVRNGEESRTAEQNAALNKIRLNPESAPFGYPNPQDAVETGWGNKTIALKLCRNVVIRDITILHGGHFVILATGVDNLTLDNLKIDTNRDGIDVDACRHTVISNCTVNSPFDDGICPKSSYALGFPRVTENLTITNCQVSGYDEGTLLDGTYKREFRPKSGSFTPTGRIKFGTESNGGFKNVTVSNCVFDYCRGLALEAVDGALLEDVTISNLTMRDITNSPLFLRLGARARGPEKPVPPGALRRVILSNIIVTNADPKYASIISGIPGHPIEDIRLSNIRIHCQGGGTVAQAALEPPENENGYPEPSMFGELPAYGFFIRHVNRLEMRDVEVAYAKEDARPPFILHDVMGANFLNLKAQRGGNVSAFVLRNVENFSLQQSWPLADTRIERTGAAKVLP
jgi:polygalacturonase